MALKRLGSAVNQSVSHPVSLAVSQSGSHVFAQPFGVLVGRCWMSGGPLGEVARMAVKAAGLVLGWQGGGCPAAFGLGRV